MPVVGRWSLVVEPKSATDFIFLLLYPWKSAKIVAFFDVGQRPTMS
jgi:hypothetical protein